MDIFYIENFKVPVQGLQLIPPQPAYELKAVCFVKTTPEDFMSSLGLDELYSSEVRLAYNVLPIYYDTSTQVFYKYYASYKQDEFAAKAMQMTLENGHVLKKIDWKLDFLSPKELILKLMKKFIKDTARRRFQDVYNVK